LYFFILSCELGIGIGQEMGGRKNKWCEANDFKRISPKTLIKK